MVSPINKSTGSTVSRGTSSPAIWRISRSTAISATRSSDKVGLLLFSDGVELFLPPRKGRRHILRIIREMLFFEPKRRGTDIPAALTFLNHVLHRRSIIFLLTDFLHSFGPAATRARRSRDTLQDIGLTNARHDLVCIHLHDPRESVLPPGGLVTVEDAETGEMLEIDSSRAVIREKFARSNAERLAELDRAMRRAGVDTLSFSTAEPFAQTLQRFFETRRGRRRG